MTETGIINTEEQSVVYATDHRPGGATENWEEANAPIHVSLIDNNTIIINNNNNPFIVQVRNK